MRECKIHGISKYNKCIDHGKVRWRCGKCQYEAVKRRRYTLKQKAVNFLGGCCEKCGYNKSLSALEFHHKDPTQKDFGIGAGIQIGWERVKAEIMKCILLCANCHRELHEELRLA